MTDDLKYKHKYKGISLCLNMLTCALKGVYSHTLTHPNTPKPHNSSYTYTCAYTDAYVHMYIYILVQIHTYTRTHSHTQMLHRLTPPDPKTTHAYINTGKYVNFGVFALYKDPKLKDSITSALALVVWCDLNDVLKFPKVLGCDESLLWVYGPVSGCGFVYG